MKQIKLNIENLTGLWKVAGASFQSYSKEKTLYCSHIENTEWPNRIWTDKPISEELIREVKGKMDKGDELTFSYFNQNQNKNPLHTDNELILKSTQYGMSLPLTEKLETQKSMDFEQVRDKADTETWSKAFYQAFNYEISDETVQKTKNEVQYFLVYHKKELVGTIVLFITDHVAGIHSLGIVPSQRKNGFATEIMYQILNFAIDQKLTLATLQASEMAKKMYLKMGFSLDFQMENFRLKH